MVLTGQVGCELCRPDQPARAPAVGLSGEDAGLFGARRRGAVVIDGVEEDIGPSARVVEVDTSAVDDITAAGRIPVVSTIAPTSTPTDRFSMSTPTPPPRPRGRPLGASKLVVLTDVEGVSMPTGPTATASSPRSISGAREVLAGVDAGMIPKLEACIAAVEGGIPRRMSSTVGKPHSLLLEVFTSAGIGTMIVPDAAETSAAQGETS